MNVSYNHLNIYRKSTGFRYDQSPFFSENPYKTSLRYVWARSHLKLENSFSYDNNL